MLHALLLAALTLQNGAPVNLAVRSDASIRVIWLNYAGAGESRLAAGESVEVADAAEGWTLRWVGDAEGMALDGVEALALALARTDDGRDALEATMPRAGDTTEDPPSTRLHVFPYRFVPAGGVPEGP
ncbi:MAG: hypothetical protein HY722_14915, partial [Planctomycetes bacterium]|nr:hypothetical protein [Planctomycetota bacterium]